MATTSSTSSWTTGTSTRGEFIVQFSAGADVTLCAIRSKIDGVYHYSIQGEHSRRATDVQRMPPLPKGAVPLPQH